MIIESENFKDLILTPTQLEEILQPYEKKLNIDLVLIALTNCTPFCKIFHKLGVSHVISFTFNELKTSILENEEVSNE